MAAATAKAQIGAIVITVGLIVSLAELEFRSKAKKTSAVVYTSTTKPMPIQTPGLTFIAPPPSADPQPLKLVADVASVDAAGEHLVHPASPVHEHAYR